MFKLPLRAMKAPERNTPQIVDADDRAILLYTVEEEKRTAALEAIVVVVNDAPAQEEKIAGLLEAVRKSLEFMHWSFCDREIDSDDPKLLEDAMRCQSVGCAWIAAAIRAAGGDCGTS